MSALTEYRRSVADARDWFDREHAGVAESFELLDAGFRELLRCIQHGRDANRNSHVSLGTLLLITQRQSFIALDALSSRQAYQGWIVLRPGLECALMMGKWVDNPMNAEIWLRRFQDQKAYTKAYSGRALVSSSLPFADELQTSLKTLNDLFAHPNISYLGRHLDISDAAEGSTEVTLSFFDSHTFHWASVLGMLHLLISLQTAIATMFSRLFVDVEVVPERFGLAQFRSIHMKAALGAAMNGLSEYAVIHPIGMWPTASPNAEGDTPSD